MLEFRARKVDGKLVFDNRAEFDKSVSELADGLVMVQLVPIGDPKSYEQVKWWYGGILPALVESFRSQGMNTLATIAEKISVDMQTTEDTVDLMMKRLWYASMLKEGVPSKSKMSKKEMHNMIEFTRHWAADNMQCVIPDPDEPKEMA